MIDYVEIVNKDRERKKRDKIEVIKFLLWVIGSTGLISFLAYIVSSTFLTKYSYKFIITTDNRVLRITSLKNKVFVDIFSDGLNICEKQNCREVPLTFQTIMESLLNNETNEVLKEIITSSGSVIEVRYIQEDLKTVPASSKVKVIKVSTLEKNERLKKILRILGNKYKGVNIIVEITNGNISPAIFTSVIDLDTLKYISKEINSGRIIYDESKGEELCDIKICL